MLIIILIILILMVFKKSKENFEGLPKNVVTGLLLAKSKSNKNNCVSNVCNSYKNHKCAGKSITTDPCWFDTCKTDKSKLGKEEYNAAVEFCNSQSKCIEKKSQILSCIKESPGKKKDNFSWCIDNNFLSKTFPEKNINDIKSDCNTCSNINDNIIKDTMFDFCDSLCDKSEIGKKCLYTLADKQSVSDITSACNNGLTIEQIKEIKKECFLCDDESVKQYFNKYCKKKKKKKTNISIKDSAILQAKDDADKVHEETEKKPICKKLKKNEKKTKQLIKEIKNEIKELDKCKN